jgi:hypothetical protein
VIAIAAGESPTRIGVPIVRVVRSTGVTVPPSKLATKAVFPSGVIAIANPGPTVSGVPAVPVATSTGVSVPSI